MSEEWRPVKGFEGLYEVSNMARVRSLSWTQIHWTGKPFTKKERIFKFRQPKTNRYVFVGLTRNGVEEHYSLHRVYMEHWVPNPDNKRDINHKNGIKWDNRPENLEWATRSENVKHAVLTGLLPVRRGEQHHTAKLTEAEVIDIRRRYATGESSWKIFKSLNMSYTNVKDIIAKRTWSHI